jgi:hypothetical protein
LPLLAVIANDDGDENSTFVIRLITIIFSEVTVILFYFIFEILVLLLLGHSLTVKDKLGSLGTLDIAMHESTWINDFGPPK